MDANREQPAPQENKNVSQKETIIQSFQEKRLALWKGVSEKIKQHPDIAKFLSAAVNATAGSYIKLSAEAYRGKTIDNQNLTPLGRIIHTFVVATGLGAYALGVSGRLDLAAISYGASWGAYGLMYGPDLLAPALRNAATKIEGKHAKTAHLLQSISNVVESPKKLFFKP